MYRFGDQKYNDENQNDKRTGRNIEAVRQEQAGQTSGKTKQTARQGDFVIIGSEYVCRHLGYRQDTHEQHNTHQANRQDDRRRDKKHHAVFYKTYG